jgi:hypothetical protein
MIDASGQSALGGLGESIGETPGETSVMASPPRRLLYWLAAMVVLLIVGTTVGLIWADTSNVAGAFAGVTNVISAVGIVVILIALVVKRRRQS